MVIPKRGSILIPDGANVWPHELVVAKVLARHGYAVEFLVAVDRAGQQTPDVLINNETWEIKSPRASSLKAVERNLKRGRWQSERIIFDSRRMKGVPDTAIFRELTQCFDRISGIKKIRFVTRKGTILDIG